MWRSFLYEIGLFALPFAAYGLWLALRGRDPTRGASWQGAPILSLLFAAVLCLAVGLGLVGHFGGAPAGSAYTPAHIENGKLVPPKLQ